jgi:hypothetical protein
MSQSGLVDPKIQKSQNSDLDFYDQMVNLGEEWVKPLFVLLLMAGLPNE